jgi:hypothetical protein
MLRPKGMNVASIQRALLHFVKRLKTNAAVQMRKLTNFNNIMV